MCSTGDGMRRKCTPLECGTDELASVLSGSANPAGFCSQSSASDLIAASDLCSGRRDRPHDDMRTTQWRVTARRHTPCETLSASAHQLIEQHGGSNTGAGEHDALHPDVSAPERR